MHLWSLDESLGKMKAMARQEERKKTQVSSLKAQVPPEIHKHDSSTTASLL